MILICGRHVFLEHKLQQKLQRNKEDSLQKWSAQVSLHQNLPTQVYTSTYHRELQFGSEGEGAGHAAAVYTSLWCSYRQ